MLFYIYVGRYADSAWLGMSILGGAYQWDDGTVVDFLPWDDSNPDYPNDPDEYCVLQTGNTFSDRSPWDSHYSICQNGTGSIQLVRDQE